MMYSQRQPVKTRQFNVTKLYVAIDGTVATPVAGGLDSKFIKTVTDLGAGNYKVTFKDKARRNLVVNSLLSSTSGVYGIVTAVDKDFFTVAFKTFAGVATDAAFTAEILYHDDSTLY